MTTLLPTLFEYSWLIPALPLLGCVFICLFLRKASEGTIGRVAIAAVGAPFLISVVLASSLLAAGPFSPELSTKLETAGLELHAGGTAAELTLWDWLPAGERHGVSPAADGATRFITKLDVPFGFYLDGLTAIMLLVITGVGSLIHIYASKYMEGEEGYWRFFAYLNLFVSMMLVLVMGSSFLMMFVGWEGVGLCSYLLIGFYYKQTFPPYAGMKAFLVNRIGDLGFIMGMGVLLATFGSLQYSVLLPRAAGSASWAGSELACIAALLLFVGAIGKSAQLPLSVWLPDAMAGPTPVSALIHAATMVTAGVYLVIRGNILFQASPTVSLTIAILGAITAIWAASIALVQNDIKKVLAYSTVSQLGYMFLAVGVGAYTAGLFHLVTHAFFKALLFLGAGSVSHGMHHELDMRKFGGLRQLMPKTNFVMIVATVAIAGLPFFAGFWSKDEILAGVMASSALPGGEAMRWALWSVGLFTAFLTSFYMFRLYYMTFHGEARWDDGVEPHESPMTMILPLRVLAVLAILGGALGIPHYLGGTHFLSSVLDSVIHHTGTLRAGFHHPAGMFEAFLVAAAITSAVLGMAVARSWYRSGTSKAPEKWATRHRGLHAVFMGKYHLDELYEALVVRPFARVASWSGSFDRWVVDGLVEGVGIGATLTGEVFRHVTSGKVRTYALAVFIGAVGMTCWLVFQ